MTENIYKFAYRESQFPVSVTNDVKSGNCEFKFSTSAAGVKVCENAC